MKNVLAVAFLVLLIAPNGWGYTLVMGENMEYREYSTHFLERYVGSGDSGYWAATQNSVTQSTTDPHSGTYCGRWEPNAEGDPHLVFGYGGHCVGSNTTNLALKNTSSRYWYFRWYQKYTTGLAFTNPTRLIKPFYLNWSSEDGSQFYFMIDHEGYSPGTGNAALHCEIKYFDGSVAHYINGAWEYASPSSFKNDGEWHKFEVILDAGTGTDANGHITFKIDDVTGWSSSNYDLSHGLGVAAGPIRFVADWPGPAAGGAQPSGEYVYMDDYEIYTLDSLSDIPPEGEESPAPAPPTISNATISNGRVQ